MHFCLKKESAYITNHIEANASALVFEEVCPICVWSIHPNVELIGAINWWSFPDRNTPGFSHYAVRFCVTPFIVKTYSTAAI